jgi:hypothetical protein
MYLHSQFVVLKIYFKIKKIRRTVHVNALAELFTSAEWPKQMRIICGRNISKHFDSELFYSLSLSLSLSLSRSRESDRIKILVLPYGLN